MATQSRNGWMGSVALGALGVIFVGQGLNDPALADTLFARDRNSSVLDRDRPDYAAQGVRAGQFIVKPRVDLGVGYTTNAFAISNVDQNLGLDGFEEESDAYFVFRPMVRADSLWSRHSLSGGAYFESFTNRRFDSEAVSNFGGFAEGQLDVRRKTALFGGVSFDHLNESRRTNNSGILFLNPVEYDKVAGFVGAKHEVNRFRFLGRLDAANFDFDDVAVFNVGLDQQDEDQDFRDRTSTSMLGRVGYALSPDLAVFVQGKYNFQDYDIEPTDPDLDRDSEGWDLALGAEFDLTTLIRGSISIGRFEQDYEGASFANAEGTSLDGQLQWFPTERTNVTLTGRRGADESSLLEAGGLVTTEGVLRVDHELRRNVTVYGLAGAGTLEYPDQLVDVVNGEEVSSDQEIERFRLGVGGKWYLNPNLAAGIDYSYESQNVEASIFEGGFSSDYDIQSILLTLSVQR